VSKLSKQLSTPKEHLGTKMGGEVSLTLEMNPLINKNLLWLLHPKNCRSGTCEKQNKQKKEDNNFTWFGYKRLHPQSHLFLYFAVQISLAGPCLYTQSWGR
jgi:hypothetical protein